MIDVSSLAFLKGKKALVTGIANDQSIAWGCAKAFSAFGADLAITYLNEKTKRYVDPLAKEAEASIYVPLDLKKPGELEAVYDTIKKKWGKLDIEPAGELVAALRGAERDPDGVRDRPVGREGIGGDHDEAPSLQIRTKCRPDHSCGSGTQI